MTERVLRLVDWLVRTGAPPSLRGMLDAEVEASERDREALLRQETELRTLQKQIVLLSEDQTRARNGYEDLLDERNREREEMCQLEAASERDREALALAMHLGQQLAGECVELERLVHGWEVAELSCPQGVYRDGTPRPCRFCEEPDD